MFKECQVKMFGSVANGTKVCEMDEYDINVILKSPFNPPRTRLQFKEAWLQFEKQYIYLHHTKPDTVVDIEITPLENIQYRTIVSSEQVSKIFKEAVRKLLQQRTDVLSSTTWKHTFPPTLQKELPSNLKW